ncbi:MAG: glycine cleavage system aminomethyltransferase GcvT [Chloroflexi bacterium]|nr:glycine cleavage system aminomethyltransferase GcvT [Chloroflexota bacterium]
MSEQFDDLLFRGDIAELAPHVADLIEREAERQARKLIMIPSESYAPLAVRQALGSVFQNIYAEGYPSRRATREPESLLLDEAHQLVYYRRYADRRFYKGVEYVDIVEALAGRRAAQCFATDTTPDEAILANVQALSGSAANLAIYDAFMQAGDTLMGLDLFQGGHLTHGSEFNISGKRYNVVSYGVDPKTERLDYDEMMRLAQEHKPRLIVAGYTAYSWAPDWHKFRQIADSVGALLMADIAHTAGLVIGGVYPSPVGIADVTVFTTHKTLGGPRGAVILTTDQDKANLIDMSIFPGAQGGPHVNKFAALCVAFKLAQTEQFKRLQQRTVENAKVLSDAFQSRGLRVVYGGTDTHIVLLDVSTLKGKVGFPLRGEMAARILDLAGIVVNKNTIPGDELTALASGIRFGTPWVTQRGLGPDDMEAIADIVHKIVTNIHPFAYQGLAGELPRGKIDLNIFESGKRDVAALADKAGIDFEVTKSGYPQELGSLGDLRVLEISGWRARPFMQEISTGNLAALEPGRATRTFLLDRRGTLVADVAIARLEADEHGRDRYRMGIGQTAAEHVKAWLRGLADGYILFDDEDVFRKVQGPVVIAEVEGGLPVEGVGAAVAEPGTPGQELLAKFPDRFDLTLPYFVGQNRLNGTASHAGKEEWVWTQPQDPPLKRTGLFEVHESLGGKIVPFAGWEMPVWYTSVSEEHAAVRNAAGLFDVSHMGCFEVSGPNAIAFLDTIISNYAHWLDDGQSCYAYLLDPDGKPVDDLMIYRRRADLFLVVVNASNEDKDWDWFNAVNERRVVIDRRRPWLQVEAPATLRNLKDPASGERQLRDLALQGPASIAILQACTDDPAIQATLARVRRTDLIEVALSGIPIVAARTGYTGEDAGFELFVHPDNEVAFWNMLLEKGQPFGIQPCGLASRDSTRTEAGLPLYGHELVGPFDISPAEAGFPGYVKYHKPFFIGRDVLLARDLKRERELIRWRMNQRGVRRPNTGDPVVNKRGQVIGHVTSCSIDVEGYLLGLAIVDRRYTEAGTPIGIFVLPTKASPEKQKSELEMGDKVLLTANASVLPRFPVK